MRKFSLAEVLILLSVSPGAAPAKAVLINCEAN